MLLTDYSQLEQFCRKRLTVSNVLLIEQVIQNSQETRVREKKFKKFEG